MASEHDFQPRDSEVQKAYFILLAGGIVGVLLLVASIVTSYYWWGPLVAFLRDSEREKLWQPLLALVGLLVALAVMFGAFQSARRFERIDVNLRRVLYGYSTFLQLLLLAILLSTVVVFVQVRFSTPYDMTEAGFYSLSEKTQKYLQELDKPVNVYLLMSPGDSSGAYDGMKTVLAEMEEVNPRYFHYEEVSIDDTRPNSRVSDLVKRFSRLKGQREGLLVTLGDNPENNQSYIAANELVNFEMTRSQQPKRSFNGEVRLMQELYFLAEDKHRPVVYITQGHGEPDMLSRDQDGLSELATRLREANYEVEPLLATSPDPEKNSVPANADLVMVIGPKSSMNDMIPALRRYMNPTDPKAKKGKLIVMLGPTEPDRTRGNHMTETGLEPFLREFNIDVTDEQILTVVGPNGRPFANGNQVFPTAVYVGPLGAATQARNPIAMLIRGEATVWFDVRRLEALPAPPGSKLKSEALLASAGMCWVETDLKKPFGQIWKQIASRQGDDYQRANTDRRTVMAAATESSAPEGEESSPSQTKQTPRLVVVGCSDLATNRYVQREAGGIEYDLIRGSIDWAREHFANIGIEPKSYRYFVLSSPGSYFDILYLPTIAMLLTVFGLGLVVWNVRRR